MAAQLRKGLPSLHNITLRPYMKMTAVNVLSHNVPVNISQYRDVNSAVHCWKTMFAGISSRNSYPTHHTSRRGYCKKDDSEEEELNRPLGFNFSFLYSAKLLFFLCLDKSIRYHLGPDFFKGSSQAFMYVTDCLQRKDYDSLVDVMTPDLLERLRKGEEKLPSLNSLKFLLISAVNIDWKFDKETKVKTLKILVRTTFTTNEEFEQGTKSSEKKQFPGGISTKDGIGKFEFAHMKLFKQYGETMKDTPWLLEDIRYLSLNERMSTSIKL